MTGTSGSATNPFTRPYGLTEAGDGLLAPASIDCGLPSRPINGHSLVSFDHLALKNSPPQGSFHYLGPRYGLDLAQE